MKFVAIGIAICVGLPLLAALVVWTIFRVKKGKGTTATNTDNSVKKEAVEKKEVAKKTEKTTRSDVSGSAWSFFKSVMVASTVIGLILYFGVFRNLPSTGRSNASDKTVAVGSQNIVPLDAAAFVVSQCESGGKQFEKDDETPLKNREGSSAAGKYQFIEAHRKPAKELGFDLNTEEGQDGYARYRILRFGLRDWEADPRSKACIAEKFASMGFKGGFESSVVAPTLSIPVAFVLTAPPKEWSKPFFFSRGLTFETDRLSNGKERIQIEYVSDNGDVLAIEEFSPDINQDRKIPGIVRRIRARSLGEEPAVVKITLKPKRV